MTDVPGSAMPTTAEVTNDVTDNVAAQTADLADVVLLTLPAVSAYVSVLRSTAAALAARLDFTIDEIEDLRIAVDEASALLLAQATPGSSLSCTFRLLGDELIFSVTGESRQPKVPSRESFAWTVLTALVGSVDSEVDPGGGRTTLTLIKRAEGVRNGADPSPWQGSQTSGNGAAQVHHLDEARQARDPRPSGTGE